MPANVKMIFICPKCEDHMSALEKPKKCPNCRYVFNTSSEELAKNLYWPKAPSRQLFEIIQQETEKAIPKESKELLPNLTHKQHEEIILGTQQKYLLIKRQWEKKRDEFFFNTDPEDVEELVQCIYFLMNRCISSSNKELIGKCTAWAKSFAGIYEYLKSFREHRGEIYERTDKPTKPRDRT